jgi:hypothetical protein
MTNFFQNMLEVYMFIVLGCMAYVHPSVNAIIYMLLSVMLFHSMTKDLKTRYLWNLLFLTIILVYMIVSTIFKFIFGGKKFKEGREYSVKEYKIVVNELLKLGFSFDWNRESLAAADELGPYKLGAPSFVASYDIEILVLICMILIGTFSLIKHYRIKNLT